MWPIIFIILGVILVVVTSYMLLTMKKGRDKSAAEQIRGIQSKITDEDNRFRAPKEAAAATARTQARAATNAEAQEIVNATVTQTAGVQADFDLKEAPFRAEETRKREQSEHDLFIELTHQALEEGISVEALIEVKKKRLLDEAERTHQGQLQQQAILLGLIAKHLLEHQAIAQLQKKLDDLYNEVHLIETSSEPESIKKRKIAAREETIRTFEEDRRGREKRLLQAYSGEDIGRVHESA
jgi:hypothetical protein